jgi:hypothetical protein
MVNPVEISIYMDETMIPSNKIARTSPIINKPPKKTFGSPMPAGTVFNQKLKLPANRGLSL